MKLTRAWIGRRKVSVFYVSPTHKNVDDFLCEFHRRRVVDVFVEYSYHNGDFVSLGIISLTSLALLLLQLFWDSKKNGLNAEGEESSFCNIHEWKHAESLHPTTSPTQPHFLMKFIIPLPCFERNYFCSSSSNALDASHICMLLCCCFHWGNFKNVCQQRLGVCSDGMGMCRCHATSFKIVTSLSLALNEFTSHPAHLDEEGNYKVSKGSVPIPFLVLYSNRIGNHFLHRCSFS